jgi:hypothetical protein
MGNADSIPVVSQVKSAVQAASGDMAGAEATQQAFIRQCPIVSQGTSAVQAALGDLQAAEQTQKEFVHHLPDMGPVEAVPVVSQLKSAVQAAKGDMAGAEATQQAFIRRCPVVAQGTSAVQASFGDLTAAEETQKEFVRHLPHTAVMLASSAIQVRVVCGSGTIANLARTAFLQQVAEVMTIPSGPALLSVSHQMTESCGEDSATCFLGETLLRGNTSSWVLVQDLRAGDTIMSTDGRLVEVRRFVKHPESQQKLVCLSVSGGSLTVTDSHRIIAIRGGAEEAVPASSLRQGDDIVSSRARNKEVVKLESVVYSDCSVEIFQLTFFPDESVESFLIPDVRILSKGHKKQTSRGSNSKGREPFPDWQTENGWD